MPTETSNRRPRYRPDLEGLRAVAIFAVIVAHAGVPGLGGGFIGVDVFFVLSGYLITGLLVQEHQGGGRIDLARFYARRFRRLLPALLLMLGVTCVLAQLLLSPASQPAQALAAATSAVWLSNFHFAFLNIDYFSTGAETNLFLHTWSLGVEEQFYLIWPALLMLAMGSGTATKKQVRRLRLVMLFMLLFSLLACIVLTVQSPLVTFYLMPTRAWQFALGALALLDFGGSSPSSQFEESADSKLSDKHARSLSFRWAGWLGLVLILAAVVGYDSHVPYPGFRALVPSLGAALILIAGADAPKQGVGAILSLRPMQAIGQVSYAWYLWHWPILILAAGVVGPLSWVQALAWSALALALAAASYRMVESPIRQGRWVKASHRTLLLGSLGLMICAYALANRWQNFALERMTSPEQMRYQQARADAPLIYAMGCDQGYHSDEVRVCEFGPTDAPQTAVAMGDSIGLQWFPALAKAFDRPGWRLLVITKSSCPMVDEPIFYARIGREYTECERWRKKALTRLTTLKPDLVILGSAFTYDFGQSQWIEGTARLLSAISSTSGRIQILRSTPVLPFDGPACLAPQSRLYDILVGDERCTYQLNDPHYEAVYQWLQSAASRFPNASVLSMTDEICPDGACRAQLDGKIVFRDTQHLSAGFALFLTPSLQERLKLDLDP